MTDAHGEKMRKIKAARDRVETRRSDAVERPPTISQAAGKNGRAGCNVKNTRRRGDVDRDGVRPGIDRVRRAFVAQRRVEHERARRHRAR